MEGFCPNCKTTKLLHPLSFKRGATCPDCGGLWTKTAQSERELASRAKEGPAIFGPQDSQTDKILDQSK